MTGRWDETWRLLQDWADGQARSERLAAQLMHEAGFEDIDPAHPLGGPDGGADGLMRRGGETWAMAVYFPHGQVAAAQTRRKAAADARAAAALGADGMAFVTNQRVTKADRSAIAQATAGVDVDVDVEIYHLERIAGLLDKPSMATVRTRFLGSSARPEPPSGLPDEVLRRASAALPATGEAWLVVAVTGEPAGPVDGEAGRLTVARARDLLEDWHARNGPPAALDLTTDAHRDAGRVVFTGARAGAPPPQPQPRWRIELGDDGSVVAAASLPHALRGEGGVLGWAGMPSEVVLDAELVVPIRRDRLELWLFTGVQLAADIRPALLAGRSGALMAAAAVLLPPTARLPRHHHVQGASMRLVDPVPHPDRSDDPDRPSPSGRPLVLQSIRADAPVPGRGPSGPAAAAAARRLAVLIEERFGVEAPLLLEAGGQLEVRRAAPEDQQLAYQYARACGLPVEARSPMDLRTDAERLRAEADAALRPPGR